MLQKNKKQKGYTLLEYAAGAALLVSLLYVGVNLMGTGIQGLLSSIGAWAGQQSTKLPI
jgi:hypothetical protein